MEGESGVTRSIIEELDSSNIQRDEMPAESGVTRSIIDERHSSDMIQRKVKVVLLEVSLMKFILRRSRDIKWKVKELLIEVSLKNFFFGYPTRSNGR